MNNKKTKPLPESKPENKPDSQSGIIGIKGIGIWLPEWDNETSNIKPPRVREMSIKTWTCKCGKVSVEKKKVCRCGLPKPTYEIKTGTGTVKTTDLKAEQKKLYDKKQREIQKNIPLPKKGEIIQSCLWDEDGNPISRKN